MHSPPPLLLTDRNLHEAGLLASGYGNAIAGIFIAAVVIAVVVFIWKNRKAE